MKALPSWCRSPGWASVRLRPPRVPLAFMLGTTLLLLLVPALLLRQRPRPQAFGLEKLMASVSLLQSFRATPDRSVPELWRQRLGGDTAERLWRLQTRTWWQFWDGQGGGQPFLAISSRGVPLAALQGLAVPPLMIGDLAILSPDLLSRQLLSDRLRPQVRPSPGLRFRCLPRLERDQAVFWRPMALGVLLGPLAPFLQDVQEGCLTLTVQSAGLTWSGEATSVEGMLLEAPQPEATGDLWKDFRPSAADPLLEVQGTSLERLLAGLLARELIRQPLAERYGFGREQLTLLRHTPFRLVLRPLAQGPFQASVELTVLTENKEKEWKGVLARLAGNLQNEGLRLHTSPPPPPRTASPASAATPPTAASPGATTLPAPGASSSPSAPSGSERTQTSSPALPSTGPTSSAASAPSAGESPPSGASSQTAGPSQPGGSRPPEGGKTGGSALKPWPTAFWTRQDGVVVGGWQQRRVAGRNDQITFFLGPKAAPPAPLLISSLPRRGGMRLMMRPQELAQRGLFPANLPEVVQRSAWLWMSAEPFAGLGFDSPLSQVQGSLVLRP